MPIWYRTYKIRDHDYRLCFYLDIDTSPSMYSLYINIEIELIKWGFSLEIYI